MDYSLQHGRDMYHIAWESALHMAKVYKETNATLDDFIGYLEDKVEEENDKGEL